MATIRAMRNQEIITSPMDGVVIRTLDACQPVRPGISREQTESGRRFSRLSLQGDRIGLQSASIERGAGRKIFRPARVVSWLMAKSQGGSWRQRPFV
jgi:hypothetical protein